MCACADHVSPPMLVCLRDLNLGPLRAFHSLGGDGKMNGSRMDQTYGPVSYTVKSVGSCASVRESTRTAVRFPMADDLRDLNN